MTETMFIETWMFVITFSAMLLFMVGYAFKLVFDWIVRLSI